VGPLVVKDGTLLVSLVMIDAENTAGESAQGNQATCFGWEIPCPRMAQGQVCLESVQINVLTRAVTPSSLELCQEIGNVIGVLNRMLKSYALCVYFQK